AGRRLLRRAHPGRRHRKRDDGSEAEREDAASLHSEPSRVRRPGRSLCHTRPRESPAPLSWSIPHFIDLETNHMSTLNVNTNLFGSVREFSGATPVVPPKLVQTSAQRRAANPRALDDKPALWTAL